MLKIIAYTLAEYQPAQAPPSTGNWKEYLSKRLTRVTKGELIVNPHLDKVQKEIMDWSVEMGLLERGSPKYHAYNEARFAELCALSLPDVSHETLLAASKLVQWLFTRDDGLDSTKGTMGTQELLLRAHDSKLMEFLNPLNKCTSASSATEKGLQELTAIISKNKPSHATQELLTTRYDEYFQGNAMEAEFRSVEQLLPIDIYKDMLRPYTSAVQVFEVFTNIMEGTELTDTDLKNILYKSLSNKAAAIVGIDNDIVSVVKERNDDFPENLILLEMAHDKSISFREAFEKTIKYRNELVSDFKKNKATLLKRHPIFKPIMDRLEMLIDGNVEWSCKTSRYAQFPEELLGT